MIRWQAAWFGGGLVALALLLPACEKNRAPSSSQTQVPAPAPPEKPPSTAEAHILARKGNLLQPGLVMKLETRLTENDSSITAKVGPQTMRGVLSRKGTASELLEGIAPGQLRRTLLSKSTEMRTTYEGHPEQVSSDPADALQGIPIIVQCKRGEWSASLESGSPDAAQEEALNEYLKNVKAEASLMIYGETARKPGDTWIVDSRKIQTFCGASSLRGPFHAEFLKVEDLDGIPCAVLKLVFDLSGEAPVGKDKRAWQVTLKGSILVHRSLADLVDLKMDSEGEMSMEGEAPEQPGVAMRIDGPMTMETTAKLKKK